MGLSAPDLGLIHLLNHEKICIKSEVEGILFRLATNDCSNEAFLLIFGPNELSAPAQGLCLNFFSSITLILTYPQHSGERYRTNGPLVH